MMPDQLKLAGKQKVKSALGISCRCLTDIELSAVQLLETVAWVDTDDRNCGTSAVWYESKLGFNRITPRVRSARQTERGCQRSEMAAFLAQHAAQAWSKYSRSPEPNIDSHRPYRQGDVQTIDSNYLNFSRSQAVAFSKPFLPAAVWSHRPSPSLQFILTFSSASACSASFSCRCSSSICSAS
jgi:hypothetical protein